LKLVRRRRIKKNTDVGPGSLHHLHISRIQLSKEAVKSHELKHTELDIRSS